MRALIFGGQGQLGRELLAVAQQSDKYRGIVPQSIEVFAPTRSQCDITNIDQVRTVFYSVRPDVVINCAALTDVDLCEQNVPSAYLANGYSVRNLQQAAREIGAHFCHVSTDYVFDGNADEPYREWDKTNPINHYGASKLFGETQLDPDSTTIRTAWLNSATGKNVVRTVLDLVGKTQGPLRFVNDQIGSPSFAHDIAPRVWYLAMSRCRGLYHVTNQGSASWFEFVSEILVCLGRDRLGVEPIATHELIPQRSAIRPKYSVLSNFATSSLGLDDLPDWRLGLAHLIGQLA